MVADTYSDEPAKEAGFQTQRSVSTKSRYDIPVLQDDNDELLFADTTHDQLLGGVIGDLCKEIARYDFRFLNEHLAMTNRYAAI